MPERQHYFFSGKSWQGKIISQKIAVTMVLVPEVTESTLVALDLNFFFF